MTLLPIESIVLQYNAINSVVTASIVSLMQNCKAQSISWCAHGSSMTDADRKIALLLEEAWKAVLAAFKPYSMQSLPQSSVAELVLQPMAAALRHGSQAMQDMTQEFWGKGGIGSVLRGFDVSVVESALASLGHHSKLVSSKPNNILKLEMWHQDSVKDLTHHILLVC